MNGFVGAMVGGFELAGRLVMGVRAVVKAAVGKRAAEPFVKEQEQESDLDALCGELVGVPRAIARQQSMALQFAEIIEELIQPVGVG